MRQQSSTFRGYYEVPYTEREDAKAMGARWDAAKKLWYAPTLGVSDGMAERWKPVYVQSPSDCAAVARQEARRYWRTSAYL